MFQRLTMERVAKMLPIRPPAAHKGNFGTMGVLAGSSQYRGAALLCVEGALRTGVGIVRLAAVEEVCAAAAVRTPCCTLLPQEKTAEGTLVPAAVNALVAMRPTAIVAGCGLGSAMALTHQLLQKTQCPLVLDADCLNALVDDRLRESLKTCAQPVILTPHLGEMARLCGVETAAVLEDPQGHARRYAQQMHCIVVLKSHTTVIVGPDGGGYLNDEAGNAGLAKGGSGDVLAGVIGGLVAQGLAVQHAAAAGVWLHAAAADLAAADHGQAGLSPAELPLYLARVLQKIEHYNDSPGGKHEN